MKRVLFIGSGLASGGAEHQCAQLMNMLVDRGYDVTYASFSSVADHYYVRPSVNRVYLSADKSTPWKVLSVFFYLLKTKADVVFAYSQRMSVLSLPALLFRPRIKAISSERNFTISAPDSFEKILVKTGLYRRSNYIVPNNYSQGRYLSKVMPSIAKKIHVIPNYTDINTYKPSPLPNGPIIRIGVCCRFEGQKNFQRFVEMLGKVKQKGYSAFHVEWYGNHTFKNDWQIAYFEEGINKIKQYGLTDVITIHDATKEVPKLIRYFDAMCLPSLHEGFSNSISEYICCGRPVICSDVSDNSVMVHEGENGFLFNPLDVDDMCRAFVSLLNTSSEQRSEMGKRSREIAESLFDKESFINSYINLIEN